MYHNRKKLQNNVLTKLTSSLNSEDIDLTDEQESELDVLMNLEAEAVRGK